MIMTMNMTMIMIMTNIPGNVVTVATTEYVSGES